MARTTTVLTEAGVRRADLLIAVTGDDSVNMLCCLTGKELGVKNTVARVRTMEYFRSRWCSSKRNDELGLSLVLNPGQAAASEISRICVSHQQRRWSPSRRARRDGGSAQGGKPLCGLGLSKMRDRYGSGILACAVEQGRNVIIQKGDNVIQAATW